MCESVYYRYDGEIVYTLKSGFKEEMKDIKEIMWNYNIAHINELSCYELNHTYFEPTFSGEYNFTNNNEYTFTYHCFSTNGKRLKLFEDFMEKDFWTLSNETVHDDIQYRCKQHFFEQMDKDYDSDNSDNSVIYDEMRKEFTYPKIDFTHANAVSTCTITTIKGNIDDCNDEHN